MGITGHSAASASVPSFVKITCCFGLYVLVRSVSGGSGELSVTSSIKF